MSQSDSEHSNQDVSEEIEDISAEQEVQIQKNQSDKGVCYLPRIPPFMNPNNLRKLLTDHVKKQRRKSGGNHKTKYVEGWVEFAKKQEAKLCALALNGTQIGGKKRHNLFYDDMWTIKYLPKFKWQNLTEKLAYDQKVREQRLKAQSNQAKKEINFYMDKVDLKKKLDKMEEKKTQRLEKINQKVDVESDGDDDQNDNAGGELPHEKKKKKNMMKIMKYNQRKRREFKQREPVLE
ncbi:UNKNOWN [Stylonychia lemnae]|uniref:Pre-rRNA-processing protein ESF2 n=1 Tax=Stylonychia lemnae TaxID=5949 RepID=A0A078AXY5_STYLE|nr:UNKNOWN [Stylonychia lemnae]|eukprot:CDW87034.1 UNKNOWN [Stylonychia lemnae]